MELWGQGGAVDANKTEAREVRRSRGGEKEQGVESICAGSLNEALDQLCTHPLSLLALIHNNGAKKCARPVQLQPCCSHEHAFTLRYEKMRQVVSHSLPR